MLAILTTHPIQYQVPLWQALAKDGTVPFEVWYLSDHGTQHSYDEQFGKAFKWDLDTLSGYPYHFLRTNKNANINRFRGLRLAEPLSKLFRKKNVKALWIQGWQAMAYWQAVWQAQRAGIQVWLRGESNDLAPPPASLSKRLAKRFLLSQLFSRIEHFLYIGQANKRLYEAYGVRPEQLHAAPYGVDNERFAQQASKLLNQRRDIRRAWNIPDEAFCALFAGKFIPKKHPLDLITAARNIQLNYLQRSLHLLFVGSGELGAALRQSCHVAFDADQESSITENKISNESGGNSNNTVNASFVGFLNQTEISKAYIAADCLVLPSDYRETWGLVVNEAMASGLPCISSNTCGCSEDMVLPIDTRLCFPTGDTGAIASALITCMEQPDLAQKSLDLVEKFNLSVVVSTINKLYGKLDL
jgi:glycosyltransferase involved in cell wall biosynthesis